MIKLKPYLNKDAIFHTYSGVPVFESPEGFKFRPYDIFCGLIYVNRYKGQMPVNLLYHTVLTLEIMRLYIRYFDLKEHSYFLEKYIVLHDLHEIITGDETTRWNYPQFKERENVWEKAFHKAIMCIDGDRYKTTHFAGILKFVDIVALYIEMKTFGHSSHELILHHPELIHCSFLGDYLTEIESIALDMKNKLFEMKFSHPIQENEILENEFCNKIIEVFPVMGKLNSSINNNGEVYDDQM